VKHIQDYYAAPIGEFEQIVLMALLRLGNGAYGAAIRRHIEDRTRRKVSVSAVYVTLQRLEAKGMVVSYVGPATPQRGGRRRRHYLMDTEGARALGRAYRTFKVMSEGVESELDAL
jgi:PadR family transcriptional regulator, regulatory protein PadR